MMFKRPRLRPVRPLVNVSLAACAIFISACNKEPDTPRDETAVAPAQSSVVTEITQGKLQAVWSTRTLSAPIRDIALSGGANPLLAAVLEGGEIQIFDLDGQDITDALNVGIEAIADGQATTLEDVPLTLFPGIDLNGTLSVYLYNAQLGEPIPIELIPNAGIVGLCAGASKADGALLQIGYWSATAPETLITGNVVKAGDSLGFNVMGQTEAGQAIGACEFGGDDRFTVHGAATVSEITSLSDGQDRKLIGLGLDGQLRIITDAGPSPLAVRDGISVKVPVSIAALSALSDVQFGGYPNGVIVVGGSFDGASKLVFVEPIGLFSDAAD